MATKATARLATLKGHMAPAHLHELQRQETSAVSSSGALGQGFSEDFPQAQSMQAFPRAAHDALRLDALLTPAEAELSQKVREFMEREVAPVIADFWERAEFPHNLVPKLGQLGIAGGTIRGYGCPGLSVMALAMSVVEIARVDGSLSTFILVHNALAMLTISLLGSEQQKEEWLSPMAALKSIGCWALTEPSNGSDASALTAVARRVPGGWSLSGAKRWIGNATFADVLVVWARNAETGQVNAFIVRRGVPGLTVTKIQNKIALRCVQNGNIKMVDVFVPDSDRLPGVSSFKDTSKVLAISRIMVAWQPVGLAMGAFDMCCRYLSQRRQFGSPLSAFQLTQERLARMLANIQGMFLMAWRLSNLYEQGVMTHGMASLVKSWNTRMGREVVSLARELLGGNGIVGDFLVAKAFCDMEAYHTYEGTYEINALVAARDITGVSSFKARS